MEKLYSSKTALKEYGGGCIIPRRDSHLLQLYAFLQKLILILAEPLGFGRTQFKNHCTRDTAAYVTFCSKNYQADFSFEAKSESAWCMCGQSAKSSIVDTRFEF